MNIQNRIDELTEEFYPAADEPGCAVLLVNGADTYTSARGLANLESHAPVTPETNFRLASVSKQFTAACILQLRDAGKLELSQCLCDFFPGFPSYGKSVQVEHLLRHTSGVRDYEKLIPSDQEQQVTDADVLAMLSRENGGDFTAGTQFRYSNSGYALLAMIVEKTSQLSFPNYLQTYIFQPTGMDETMAFVDKPDLPVPANRAMGYALDADSHFVLSDQNVTTAVLGDGGVYSSAADFSKWIRRYMAGEVVAAETVQESWLPGKTANGEDVPYGYGWRLETRGNSWGPYHPGSTSGFRNGCIVDHRGNWAVAVFSNRANGDALSLARRVQELVSDV